MDNIEGLLGQLEGEMLKSQEELKAQLEFARASLTDMQMLLKQCQREKNMLKEEIIVANEIAWAARAAEEEALERVKALEETLKRLLQDKAIMSDQAEQQRLQELLQ